jgi:hypothetical protein
LLFLHYWKLKSNIFYTTVHIPPDGTVTTTPEATVIGPKLPALIPDGIEYDVFTICPFCQKIASVPAPVAPPPPDGPVDPAGPVAPVTPVAPVGPVAPFSPPFPVAPVIPVDPT